MGNDVFNGSLASLAAVDEKDYNKRYKSGRGRNSRPQRSKVIYI